MCVPIYFSDFNNISVIFSCLLSVDCSAQQVYHENCCTSETSELAVNTEWHEQKEDKQKGWRGEDIKFNNFYLMSASTATKCSWLLLCLETDRRPQHQKWKKPRLQPGMPNRQLSATSLWSLIQLEPPFPCKAPERATWTLLPKSQWRDAAWRYKEMCLCTKHSSLWQLHI